MLPPCETSSSSESKPAPPLFRTDMESPRINPSPTTSKERTSRCKSKLDASQRSWVDRALQLAQSTKTSYVTASALRHVSKTSYTDNNKLHVI